MVIHTVQPGDTIYSIAEQYNIPYTRLEQDNNLPPNYRLNIGQNLMITNPEQIYIVQEGDTVSGIADRYGVTVNELLRNNPQLSDRNYLYIGEEIIISYNRSRQIEVMGYTNTFINEQILRKTLPFLTYITIFNYIATAQGDFSEIDDTWIIQLAKDYDVVPVMALSSINPQGQGNQEVTHIILSDETIQTQLIDRILANIKAKGYSGLNLSFYDVLSEDLPLYVNFITSVTNRLNREGYEVFVALSPLTFGYEPGNPYNFPYYSEIGRAANYVILITYLWATSAMSEVTETNADYLRQYLDFAVTEIPPEKIFIGLTRIAYDWELPYTEGRTRGYALTNAAAVELANQLGITIEFDEVSQTPFFYYNDSGVTHYVRFKDARSINAILSLISEYGLRGVAVWNIMYFYSQTWLSINSDFGIESLNHTD